MPAHTHYLWFETKKRQEIIDITDEVSDQVRASRVKEGFVLVSAMHISASVFVNDHESASGTTSSSGWRTPSPHGNRRATGTMRPVRTTPRRISEA
jgi:hypothetical protein